MEGNGMYPKRMSFDEWQQQDEIVLDDKSFFDALDRKFGIDPETGELEEDKFEDEGL